MLDWIFNLLERWSLSFLQWRGVVTYAVPEDASPLMDAAIRDTHRTLTTMEPYWDELTALCAQHNDERERYVTDDVLGRGYFMGRRVMSIMKARHPELPVRDLWRAVDLCSAQLR